jgi:hypothetical protein
MRRWQTAQVGLWVWSAVISPSSFVTNETTGVGRIHRRGYSSFTSASTAATDSFASPNSSAVFSL